MAELNDLGFGQVSGADISSALMARGPQARPDLRFELIESPPKLNHPAASFDVVMLFAVLTCIPDDHAQRELVAELHRLLAAGGLLYLSELTVQPDERNRRRYAGSSRPNGCGTPGSLKSKRAQQQDAVRCVSPRPPPTACSIRWAWTSLRTCRTPNGNIVYQITCNRTDNQLWAWEEVQSGNKWGLLVNLSDGRCLDVTNVSYSDGAPLQVWDCGGGWNQRWNIF